MSDTTPEERIADLAERVAQLCGQLASERVLREHYQDMSQRLERRVRELELRLYGPTTEAV